MHIVWWNILSVGAFALAQAESSSKNVLSSFAPPPHFRNTNGVRTIDLTRPYVRETIALNVENIGDSAESDYYYPVPLEDLPRISYLEASDKKPQAPLFKTELVEFDSESTTQYYKITFSKPLEPNERLTISISTAYVDSVRPLPAVIGQIEPQFLLWEGSRYILSAYPTDRQKTRVKLPSSNIVSCTKTEEGEGTVDPSVAGSGVTYGPYEARTAGAYDPIYIRYEHTTPILAVDRFEREVEVSHWGGNLAVEEKYWLRNAGQFSRVEFTRSNYFNRPPSVEMKQLDIPLHAGARDAYFIDEIGNVSTSRFRKDSREALLELKPRYPLFGGWNYTFTIGWNQDVASALKAQSSGHYILKVPFLEGPVNTQYHKVHLRILLPEGASNVEIFSPVPLVGQSVTRHHSFLDTLGRTAVILDAINVVDEKRYQELVITYDYTFFAGLRKPLSVMGGIATALISYILLSKIDTSIGRKR